MDDFTIFDRSLTITLENHAGTNKWVAVSVVLSDEDQNHRVSFTKPKSLKDVLCPELVSFLEPYLTVSGKRKSVTSVPDAEVRLQGLVLRRLRLVYSSDEKANERALVRFSGLAGNPNVALVSNSKLLGYSARPVFDLCPSTLDWVLIPALNAAALNDVPGIVDAHGASLEACLHRLENSRTRIHVQIELVRQAMERLENAESTERRRIPHVS